MIRRKIPGILVVTLSLLLFTACKKTAEKVIDCIGESLLTSVQHSPDNTNAKKVDFTIRYTGQHSITSISIDYGDGQTAPVSGTTISHIYAQPGTYQVKATVSLKAGKGTCEVKPTKQVTVN